MLTRDVFHASLGAKSEMAKGVTTLARLTRDLNEEWQTEATFAGEVSDAFDLPDVLPAAAAKKG
ncbi:hypothetical protein ACH4S8_26575 [Streptomyces sp. NPDC021080]|uniref:hypothetical protein n=1 Tax=Streptomyces sp. NPDC021080 TaxID=3365110 RepID=UPI00379955EE